MAPNPFIGRWRIVEMEVWGADMLDLLGPAHLVFDGEGFGSLQFVAVRGSLHCHYGTRDREAAVEFSWEDDDDGDPRLGRGWAVIDGDEEAKLQGHIFIHCGDDSAFTAVREDAPAPSTHRVGPKARPSRPSRGGR